MTLRQEFTKDIVELLDDMDPSGKNTDRMLKFLNGIKSDKEFDKFAIDLLEDDNKFIPVAYEIYNNPVNMDFINHLMEKYNIPLYEYVYKPYLTGDIENPPATVHKMMVIDYPVKRLKQMVFSKNHTSTSATKKDPKTGQVTGADKTARVTDIEGFSLIVQEQYHAAQEQYGPLADDSAAHYEMLRLIQQNGEVELSDLPNDPINKTTLNTIFYYMLGSCITSNLIEQSGYVLPATLEAREEAKKE